MSMQSMMAADLAALFAADMPADCRIGGNDYTVLIDDCLTEENEAFGGGEALEIQRVHFLTSEISAMQIGIKIAIRQRNDIGVAKPWKTKIVLSTVTSADGNELIATVRGA